MSFNFGMLWGNGTLKVADFLPCLHYIDNYVKMIDVIVLANVSNAFEELYLSTWLAFVSYCSLESNWIGL